MILPVHNALSVSALFEDCARRDKHQSQKPKFPVFTVNNFFWFQSGGGLNVSSPAAEVVPSGHHHTSP